ncbi:transglutaminase-like domain-containing protein [Humibacter sp. RRB41]|uniref:transglutaminase-like domain-containing protein n=1 Tax=Humibacter sp. RRB41 TaxID=2919946 RepID=UPI001FAA7CF5|nr:transglutaminase-like domain-containing protein [Humibacter sp. RRB41]
MTIDYSAPGVFTDLRDVPSDRFEGIGGAAPNVCGAVPTLFVQPYEMERLGVPSDRLVTNQVRAAGDLVDALWQLDPTSLSQPRAVENRAVGTCRHFTVLSVALLRRAGIEARARCGFATYFQPGQALDHWIVEWNNGERWIRMDTEVLGTGIVPTPDDLAPGAFLTGGEAWQAFRRGEIDASTYGVYGTTNFGPSEIRGNLVRDLASLVKVETLPWDEWGRMTAAYQGTTGPDYDGVLDDAAGIIAGGDPSAIRAIASHPDLVSPFESASAAPEG